MTDIERAARIQRFTELMRYPKGDLVSAITRASHGSIKTASTTQMDLAAIIIDNGFSL